MVILMDKNIGKKLDGRYEITELIGIGGMADVYKAVDIIDDRTVAVKILKTEFLNNDDFIRRFRNESKAIAVLSHPNIVKIYDVGFTDRIQFIVMEYIDGITLKEFIEQQGVLKWKDCVHFIIQILRALQHAHDRGIVHRDIKPQNIMLFPDGTIKVMDFGIARFAREEGKTISDKAIGSVHYISPEQARGDVTDEKSDIYSVGVMLYEMLTGVKPFDADNPVSVALMHMQNDAKTPRAINDSIPEGLEEIVVRAMQKDASKRYQSASEMIKDIEEFKKNPSIVFEYTYISEKTQYYNSNAVSRAAAAYESNMSKNKPETDTGIMKKSKSAHTRVKSKKNYDDYDNYDGEDEEVSKSSYFIVILTAIAAVVIIVVVVFIAYALNNVINPPPSETEKMPELVGFLYQDVKTYYAQKFEVTVDSQEYSSEYSEGIIISQNPAKDRDYIVGKTVVKVTVSRGPRMVTIPNVYDLEAKTAQNMLKGNEGFNVVIKSAFDEKVEKDYVIMTEPARYEQAEFGSTVYMYVSRGPEIQEVIVPDVVGKNLDAAKTLLGKNFTVQVMEADDPAAKDTVLEQSIPALTETGEKNIVKINQTIILTISTGVVPQSEGTITIKIPSGVEGAATFNCYINGTIVGSNDIDNIAYASTVSVKVTGNDLQKVMLEAVNNDTGDRATIGEYIVDFVAGTVTESDYDRNTFKSLFGASTVTTSTESEPDIIVDDDGGVIIDEDDEFWDEIFGLY